MSLIGFVSCSKLKADAPAPAASLYTSPLFRKSLLAALDHSEKVYVLSAKHGVVPLSEIVAPYDVTLKSMPIAQRVAWAERAGAQLIGVVKSGDIAALYCGHEYASPLQARFGELGVRVHEPLHGLSLGRRLQTLIERNEELALDSAHRGFRALMRKLWAGQEGGREIAGCSGKDKWPRRGVYIVVEPSDPKAPHKMGRIVRIGTHAVSAGSQTTLWDRLGTHRGVAAGGGSHRSSIFRLHVGRALMQHHADRSWPSTWSQGQSAPKELRAGEQDLERFVSETIGKLRVLWLNIGDQPGPDSDRSYVERNSIGVLSRANLLSPAHVGAWLGQHSPDWRIGVSGLWNLDHLFTKPDAAFLTVLKRYVEITLSGAESPSSPIAPRTRLGRGAAREAAQLILFSEAGAEDVGCEPK
jgi:hypothetical protein